MTGPIRLPCIESGMPAKDPWCPTCEAPVPLDEHGRLTRHLVDIDDTDQTGA